MPTRRTRIGWLLAASLSLAAPALAQTSAFQPRFDAELARHGVVGGGIAVVRGPGPAMLGFHGQARADKPQPVDAETAYNWASITKTFTAIAIAILQLRDRGRLSLDDPAVRYVPELREVHDAFGPVEVITIRDLLTHSAGFRNPTWPWDCDDGGAVWNDRIWRRRLIPYPGWEPFPPGAMEAA